MANFTITLGNKNYSSWSLRGWLALKQCAVAFDEVVIPLRRSDTAAAIAVHSPSRRVPALTVHDADLTIWDSLAIAEYLAERFPEAGLWPAESDAKAVARAVAAEMHSGFPALRRELPMDMRRRDPELGQRQTAVPGVAEDIARIVAIWEDCRARFGDDGAFLFGAPGAADAAFAPVASRFVTYAVALPPVAAAYRDAIMTWPAFQDWAAAADEPWVIDFPELDRPAQSAPTPAR